MQTEWKRLAGGQDERLQSRKAMRRPRLAGNLKHKTISGGAYNAGVAWAGVGDDGGDAAGAVLLARPGRCARAARCRAAKSGPGLGRSPERWRVPGRRCWRAGRCLVNAKPLLTPGAERAAGCWCRPVNALLFNLSAYCINLLLPIIVIAGLA